MCFHCLCQVVAFRIVQNNWFWTIAKGGSSWTALKLQIIKSLRNLKLIFFCQRTKHPFGREHPEHVGSGVVLERDSGLVADRHAPVGVPVHFEGAVLERSHCVHPRLLGRVHEARVDPTRHAVELKNNGIKFIFTYIHTYVHYHC